MTPTSMNDLPVEIHASILSFLLSFSLHPPPLSYFPVAGQWTDRGTRSKFLFPFNVASVCRLWCDILSKIPECWTRVVFDVATDPTRFLDAFLWSKNLERIEVMVFSSLGNVEEVDKALENRHVSAIVHALQPHIHRCKSIIFDITYSSSLPLPTIVSLHEAPKLKELVLDACVDDIDLAMHPGPLMTEEARPSLFTPSFPFLIDLTIIGFWFMALGAHNPKWLVKLRCHPGMRLHISHFKFLENGPYSLRQFVTLISENEAYNDIYFQDLSLAYPYNHSDPSNPSDFEICTNIHFQSVSKGFISHLYSLVDLRSRFSLSFHDCEIPNIVRPQHADHLTLVNISNEDSLRNVLREWNGDELTIRSCASFNDPILSWLESNENNAHLDAGSNEFSSLPFPAASIGYLNVIDCHGFTSRAIRDAIRIRNQTAFAWARENIAGFELSMLNVIGKVPGLTQEDKDWFEANAHNLSVYWRTIQDDGSHKVEFPVYEVQLG